MTEYDFQNNYEIDDTEKFLRNIVEDKFSDTDRLKIVQCLNVIKNCHDDQKRSDGRPYIIHPMRVALLLLKYENQATMDLIISALLHDVLEDTKCTERDIGNAFGGIVLNYVRAVTRYRPKNETPEIRMEGKQNKWKNIMQATREIRVIKTYDYLDNMISWKFISIEKPDIRKIPRWLMEAETMYLPLAKITNMQAYELMQKEMAFYLSKGHKIGDWHSDQNK